jgi:hypothetical protein
MCCGSRRAAWRSAASAPTRASGRASAIPSTGGSSQIQPTTRGQFPSVLLDYQEGLAIRVRGPVTGQRYDFSPSQPSLAVDARDAAILTRSSAFRHSAS